MGDPDLRKLSKLIDKPSKSENEIQFTTTMSLESCDSGDFKIPLMNNFDDTGKVRDVF